MAGTLYIVATPIGNLEDMTPRAAATFGSVDFIAAEDTRVTLKLLNHLGLKKPLVSYYEHNLKERGRYILDRIQAGENCALCSDAGMPAISDPGEVIFYEAPHKLRMTLGHLQEAFGPDRSITLARELTKLHEEVVKTTLGEAVEYYETNNPRGEYVLVMAGASPAETQPAPPTLDEAAQKARELMEGDMSASAAAKQAAQNTPFSKSQIYRLLTRQEENE